MKNHTSLPWLLSAPTHRSSGAPTNNDDVDADGDNNRAVATNGTNISSVVINQFSSSSFLPTTTSTSSWIGMTGTTSSGITPTCSYRTRRRATDRERRAELLAILERVEALLLEEERRTSTRAKTNE